MANLRKDEGESLLDGVFSEERREKEMSVMVMALTHVVSSESGEFVNYEDVRNGVGNGGNGGGSSSTARLWGGGQKRGCEEAFVGDSIIRGINS